MNVATPFRAQAIWSIGATNKEQDLGFIEGDIIEVTKVYSNGTGYGHSLRTKLGGIFPMKHVKVLELSESPSRKSLNTIVNSSSSQSLNKHHSSSSSLSTSHRLSSQASIPQLTRDISQVSIGRSSSDAFSSKYEGSTASESSFPPPPPKHTYVSSNNRDSRDNFTHSNNNLQSSMGNSDYWKSYSSNQKNLDSSLFSTDTERSSYFGHSDFSATSASSFIRHKSGAFISKLRDIEENGSRQQKEEIINELVHDPKSTKHPKFLRKFLSKKEEEFTIDDKIFRSSGALRKSEPESDLTIGLGESVSSPSREMPGFTSRRSSPDVSFEIDLERSKTLSSRERSQRKLRALEDDMHLILQPHKSITSVNKNETTSTFRKSTIDSVPFHQVDSYIKNLPYDKYSSIEKIAVSKIGNRFKTDIERLRALYMFFAQNFTVIDSKRQEKLSTRSPPDLDNVIFNARGTSFQLTWMFYVMASQLDIEAEIVLGHFKKPLRFENIINGPDASLVLNHSWISVLINGEYRFIDVSISNPSNSLLKVFNLDETSLEDNQEFYFLAKPLELIYTHSPLHVDNQHITPPIDPLMQLSLPPLYPSFLLNGLRFYKFDHSLFRLQDYQVSEFDLEIPDDIEIKAEINSADFSNYPALVQIYWKKERRLAKIKSILPPQCSMGFLCVYSNLKDSPPNAKIPLSLSIPVYHTGKYKPLNWVKINEEPLHSFDLYVKSPQVFYLKCKESYTFNIVIHKLKKSIKHKILANLLSPSGKIFELERDDESNPNSFEVIKQVREVGPWRLIVPNDTYSDWHIFCEWECIA